MEGIPIHPSIGCHRIVDVVVVVQSLSRGQLFCNPIDCSLPGSSGHAISQARILEWLPCLPPRDLPGPGIKLASLHWQADSLLLSHQGKKKKKLNQGEQQQWYLVVVTAQ